MPVVTMKELLEAGVHFGHQSKRWNPKMKKYIYAARNDIHVIDLHKSIPLIEEAYEFIKNAVVANGTVLFIGTKKQAQEAVEEEAKRCGMFYINQRWLGGTLTNFKTLKKNIARLKQIELWKVDGTFEKLPKKEVIQIGREYKKLLRGLDGIRDMASLPACVFVVDTLKEDTALKEAVKLGIPVVAIVDTNSDPDPITYPIPANDDAIRSIKLITRIVAEAVIAGREISKPVDEAAIEIAKPMEETEIEPSKEEVPTAESPAIEVPEEAHFLTEEERLESLALAKIKLEEEEKRTGF